MNEAEIPESWRAALGPVFASAELQRLDAWLREEEHAGKAIYPAQGCRLRAFELTPLGAVKVVILGQDPYHGPGQAMGLCFAVPEGISVPPSLVNIYKELEADCGIARPGHGDLSGWARQGVLLLNTSLTVEEGRAGSHSGIGWESVTAAAIAAVAASANPAVFVLWGKHAQAKAPKIEAIGQGRHLIISSAHPSPLSAYRGFFGSRPFSRANAFLEACGRDPIDWRV